MDWIVWVLASVGVGLVLWAILYWIRPPEPQWAEPYFDPTWRAALLQLREELGRDPTVQELVDRKYLLTSIREIYIEVERDTNDDDS